MTFDPTPNLGLKKIDYGSAAWDADEHANADKIDAATASVGFAARFADFNNFTIYDTSASPIKYTPTDEVDPYNWFSDEAPYSSGYLPHPVPTGGLLRLPPGWYEAWIYQAWNGISLPSGADYELQFEHADDPGPLDPIFGGNRYDFFQVGGLTSPPPNSGFKNITTVSILRVPSKMLNDTPVTTWPCCINVYANHFGQNVTGYFGSVLIRRVGPA